MNETGAAVVHVAPLAGARIEIGLCRGVYGIQRMSLPSRERGLKLEYNCMPVGELSSLPSRERGLKLLIISI